MARTSGLTAAQLFTVVDAGMHANAAERGRIMLAASLPQLDDERLDELSLGQRDAHVLELRCGTFGETLSARVSCPSCSVRLSVRIPREHVALQPPSTDAAPVVHVEHGPVVVEACAPDGAALLAAAACHDVAAARASLIAGCIVSARIDGESVDPLRLDDATLDFVGQAIVAAEPQVDVRVGMSCASCGHELTPVLDIVQFLWRELSAASVHLLDEVHQLAMGYGWSEEQVLQLPAARRRQYVERLTSA